MAEELIFTSVPKGLKSGSDGYCTVAYTDGMSANAVKFLESISDYSFLSLDDPNLKLSPVSFRHYRHQFGTQTKDIISRVAFFGFDYTKRSNKLAHHILLSADERPHGGPGWLCTQSEYTFFLTEWNREPELRKYRKVIPQGEDHLDSELTTWRDMAGDAGWAGKLAETFLADPEKPSYIIYDIKDSAKIIELIREALLLLPPEKRWDVTFNTYFTGVRSVECAWRCCLKDAPVLAKARGVQGTLIIDLSRDSELPTADGGELVKAARDGKIVYKQQAIPEKNVLQESLLPDSDTENQKIELFGALKEEGSLKGTNSHQASKVTEIAHPAPLLSESHTENAGSGENEEFDKSLQASLGRTGQRDKGSGKKTILGMALLVAVLIIIVLLFIIIKQKKEQVPLISKTEQDKHPAKLASDRKVLRKSQITQPEKVEEKPKEQPETVNSHGKNPTEESPEPKTLEKVIPAKSLGEQTKNAVVSKKEEGIWRQYQKTVRHPGASSCEILLPYFKPGTPFKLIWKGGKRGELKSKGVAPEISSDGVIVNSMEGAGLGEITKICEFRINFSENNTKLIIDKYRDSVSLVDLANDIEAIKIGTELYPLQYTGGRMLDQGKGEVFCLYNSVNQNGRPSSAIQDRSESKVNFKPNVEIGVGNQFLGIKYAFSGDDILAGIDNQKKYSYDLKYNDEVLDLKPEVSDREIQYYLPYSYSRNMPEFKKVFKKAEFILNNEFSQNLKEINKDREEKFTDDTTIATLQEALRIEQRACDLERKKRYDLILEPVTALKRDVKNTIKQTRLKQNADRDRCRKVLNELLADLTKIESAIKKNSVDAFRKYLAETHIKKVYIGDEKGRRHRKGVTSGKLNELDVPSGLEHDMTAIKKQLAGLNLMGIKGELDKISTDLETRNLVIVKSAIARCIDIKKRLSRGPVGVVELILNREDLRKEYEDALKLLVDRLSIIIKKVDNGEKVKTVTFIYINK